MMGENELKMWIIVRGDIHMSSGKLAVQAGHGILTSFIHGMLIRKELCDEYFAHGQAKITVVAKNLNHLQRAYDECNDAGLPCALIKDAGRTEFAEPTYTVATVGPCYRSELPNFVKRLRLMIG